MPHWVGLNGLTLSQCITFDFNVASFDLQFYSVFGGLQLPPQPKERRASNVDNLSITTTLQCDKTHALSGLGPM